MEGLPSRKLDHYAVELNESEHVWNDERRRATEEADRKSREIPISPVLQFLIVQV